MEWSPYTHQDEEMARAQSTGRARDDPEGRKRLIRDFRTCHIRYCCLLCLLGIAQSVILIVVLLDRPFWAAVCLRNDNITFSTNSSKLTTNASEFGYVILNAS